MFGAPVAGRFEVRKCGVVVEIVCGMLAVTAAAAAAAVTTSAATAAAAAAAAATAALAAEIFVGGREISARAGEALKIVGRGEKQH